MLTGCFRENKDRVVPFDTADCAYFGNLHGTGSGLFFLVLSNNARNYVRIQGYDDLKDFADFKLEERTWHLGAGATWGYEKTFSQGGFDENDIPNGTFIFEYDRLMLIIDGSFDVRLSDDNTYLITANFTGRDYHTGLIHQNIRIKFAGTVKYYDETEGV